MYDAVRVRLIEIGEAVRAVHPDLLAREPAIPWLDIAGMRNHLAHRYFDTAHAIVQATIDHDLPALEAAVDYESGTDRPLSPPSALISVSFFRPERREHLSAQ